MEILTLSVRREFFDRILSGEKKQEFREIRPSTQSRYCLLDENGNCVMRDGAIAPRRYDAIRFYTGAYSGRRPSALVEVKDAEIQLFVDENGEFVELEQGGIEYYAAQVVYTLGAVTERPRADM